jgi:hypothetical protein
MGLCRARKKGVQEDSRESEIPVYEHHPTRIGPEQKKERIARDPHSIAVPAC